MRFAKLAVLVWCVTVAVDRPDGGVAHATERVLVFTKTAGFRHDSIPSGLAMLQELGNAANLEIEATEDAASFTPATLSAYNAIVWLNTTGDVLNPSQQDAFRAYMEAGGGYVGIHSAADTEHDWAWYGELLGAGAWFRSHPAIQTAEVIVEDTGHSSTAHLASRFSFTDEWYNFQGNPRASVTVLLAIDETTYDPGPDRMGDHPIAWYHQIGDGRAWYTNLGHRDETYADEAFRRHVLGGLLWASGCDAECVQTPTPSPLPTPASCVGDCDENGSVAINELVRGVKIALAGGQINECPALDADLDAIVSVSELITAVTFAAEGCPQTAMPTPTPTSCGDPDVTQRFARCQGTETEADCVSAGGTWGRYPYSGIEACLCPTGQGGCLCNASSDCVGRCFALPATIFDCSTTHQGNCSTEEPQAGCWCEFGEEGRSYGFCNDP